MIYFGMVYITINYILEYNISLSFQIINKMYQFYMTIDTMKFYYMSFMVSKNIEE